MKLIIAGSRSLNSISLIYKAIEDNNIDISTIDEIVSGTAKGVDQTGEIFANLEGIPITQFPADWGNLEAPGAYIKHGRYGAYNSKAGFDRNTRMAKYADALLALSATPTTPGTAHMIKSMIALGKHAFVYYP